MENITEGVANAVAPATPSASVVLDQTFFSDALGREMSYRIYLPPGYGPVTPGPLDFLLRGQDQPRYPVLYLLHGLGATNRQWSRLGVFDEVERADRRGAVPAIVVLPTGNTGYWVNQAGGGARYGDYVAQDLVAHIDGAYRTVARPDARALGGISMGGNGALQIGLNYPGVFGTVGAHSPALRTRQQAPYFMGGFFPGSGATPGPEAYAARDPLSLVKSGATTAPGRLWVDIGQQDVWAPRVQELHAVLLERGWAAHLAARRGGARRAVLAAPHAGVRRLLPERPRRRRPGGCARDAGGERRRRLSAAAGSRRPLAGTSGGVPSGPMPDFDTSARDARKPARDPWDIEHRLGYPSIQEVAPAPDGRRTVYVVREPLLRDDRSEFLSHLYLASGEDADGDAGGAQQLTFGDHRNTSPRWSPDGRHIAFLSTRSGQANVYCLRASGGEAWALTAEAERSVQGLEWSPDGRSLAFCLGDLPDEARQAAGRRRDDARVWGSDRRCAHLYVVPFRIGPRTPPEPRRLTAGPSHVIGFDWLPDGERIAFSHRPLPEWDHWWETRLGLIAPGAGGDAPAEVVDLGLTGDWSARPLASPDGRWVACHTSDREGKWALSGRVVLYPVPGASAVGGAGGRAPRPLAETPNGKCDPFGWSAGWATPSTSWSRRG